MVQLLIVERTPLSPVKKHYDRSVFQSFFKIDYFTILILNIGAASPTFNPSGKTDSVCAKAIEVIAHKIENKKYYLFHKLFCLYKKTKPIFV